MPNYEKVNSKVIRARVAPGQQVVSRRGAMLGYTGQVAFHPAQSGHGGGGHGGFGGGGLGGGLGGLMGTATRMMAGEHEALMVGEGSGEVYYGFRGLHVGLVQLDGSRQLTIESSRLLAHDASLSSSVVFLGQQGGIRGAVRGAVSGQGLFTTQLSGVGDVAFLAHGAVISLQVDGARQIVVDPQAYLAHLGAVNLDLSVKAGWRDAIGRGSGEAIQLKASGSGTVFVQASEQKL